VDSRGDPPEFLYARGTMTTLSAFNRLRNGYGHDNCLMQGIWLWSAWRCCGRLAWPKPAPGTAEILAKRGHERFGAPRLQLKFGLGLV